MASPNSFNFLVFNNLVLLFTMSLVFLPWSGTAASDARGWLCGHATFYGADQNPSSLGGACGYDNTYPAGFGMNTAAVSEALFQGGKACGACYRPKCNVKLDPKWCLPLGGGVTITVTNFCPPNHHGGWCDLPRRHLDMSMPAFSSIALAGSEGIVPVLYKRVVCERRGGIRFTMRGNGSFNLVTISSVGGSGDVKAAWIRGSKTKAWVAMQRNWGATWQSRISRYSLQNQMLSFRRTLVDGKTLELLNVAPSTWRFGETFTSLHQFP